MTIGVIPMEEEEPQNKKRNWKYRSKKEKPQTMDPLIVSPMVLDDETNATVSAYKYTNPYSPYKDDVICCRIFLIL